MFLSGVDSFHFKFENECRFNDYNDSNLTQNSEHDAKLNYSLNTIISASFKPGASGLTQHVYTITGCFSEIKDFFYSPSSSLSFSLFSSVIDHCIRHKLHHTTPHHTSLEPLYRQTQRHKRRKITTGPPPVLAKPRPTTP